MKLLSSSLLSGSKKLLHLQKYLKSSCYSLSFVVLEIYLKRFGFTASLVLKKNYIMERKISAENTHVTRQKYSTRIAEEKGNIFYAGQK